MRKFPLFLALLPFLTSCYEKIILPAGEKEPVLVMNAQMKTLEDVHSITLSVSHLSKVEPLRGAEVKVYVNGSFVTDAIEGVGAESYNASWYGFEHTFHPGDEVRITARKDAFSASATVTVPPFAPVTVIDTSTVRMAFLDEVSDYLQVKARFQDLPGRSWYGVDCLLVDSCDYLDEDGSAIPEYSVPRVEMGAWMETGFDPVISEGAGKSAGGDLASLLSAGNPYNCFSDDPVVDEECTLRVLLHPQSLYLNERNYAIYYPSGFNPEDEMILWNLPRRVKRKCFFRLRSLDFSQYHYLKALSNLEAFGSEVSFLVEPTTLPSNVEGGLGFVGIETVSEVEFASFEHEYAPLGDYYLY